MIDDPRPYEIEYKKELFLILKLFELVIRIVPNYVVFSKELKIIEIFSTW
jgi:hypothetical protein